LRAIIIVEGGLVQDVITDEPLDYIIIDKDETDSDELSEISDPGGDIFSASITEYKSSTSPKDCDCYFDQMIF